jgi:hypothetical protein
LLTRVDAIAISRLGLAEPGPAWSPAKLPPRSDDWSVTLTSSRAPVAASGGQESLGRLNEVMASDPSMVTTSVFLVLKNLESAASCPNFSETFLSSG